MADNNNTEEHEAEERTAAAGAANPSEGESAEPGSVKQILADVAAGRIDPAEAAKLLDRAHRATGVADEVEEVEEVERMHTEDPVAPIVGRTPTASSVSRVRIRALGRRVKIIGEPYVKTVAIDGPHVIKHEGDTLVVTSEGELGASLDGFTLLQTRSLRDVQERVLGLGRELSIRINPSLVVEAEVTAGSLSAERLPGLEHVRITAGSARVRDADGPLDLLVQAGSATVEGKFTKGHTRLRGESGSLQVHPLPGSDVRIRHDVQLGRIVWEPDGVEKRERVLGAGTATLDLEVVMGQVTVQEVG